MFPLLNVPVLVNGRLKLDPTEDVTQKGDPLIEPGVIVFVDVVVPLATQFE
jgi:hypothetical protein